LSLYPLDLVHPDDRELVKKKAIESLKGGNSFPYEYRFIKKDGGVIWVLERLTSTEYRGKRSAVGSFMDITKRKQSEEALAKSEERFRTIMDEMHDDYFEVDLAGNYTFVNDALCRSVGYTAEELIGMNFKITNIGDDMERIYKAFNQVYRTGQPIKAITFGFVRKDGSYGVGELVAFPLRNDKGEIVGFRGISHDVSERVRMEETLRRSEEKYRNVLEGIEESYYEVDLAGNYTFFNNALCRQLVYSREELMGMNYRVYTPPENVKEVFQAFNQVYKTGEPLKLFNMEQIRKDGTRIVADPSIFPLRNEKGEIVGFRGISRDVTERVKMEEALKRSEERYRTIMDETHDDYYEVDLAGNYTFVNDAWCRSVGYTAEELIGMNYRATNASEDIERTYKTFHQIYLTGQPIKALSTKFVRKDGSHGVGELSAFPMRDEKGQIIGFRGVSHDVTERLRMEEALRQSEEKYRTILEEIEEGYYEVDLKGNIKFVNRAACRQFGYSEEELIGSNYRAYVLKEDIKGVYKAWNKVYRTGEPLHSYPFATVRKDGTQIFVENSVSPLRNKEGKIIGFRAVSRDVTQRKQFEQKLADLATHDSLTGLPNRNLLDDRLTMGLALSRRSGNKLAVLMLDLDRFKIINDTMGHAVGDQLLKSVAERLTGVIRKSDTAARIGGDEFVLVLPHIHSPSDAAKLAQRILDIFREPFIIDGHQLNISTSIGIAVYPETGKEIDMLLKNSDKAMYQAKEQGRNMYKFYGDDAAKAGGKARKRV